MAVGKPEVVAFVRERADSCESRGGVQISPRSADDGLAVHGRNDPGWSCGLRSRRARFAAHLGVVDDAPRERKKADQVEAATSE